MSNTNQSVELDYLSGYVFLVNTNQSTARLAFFWQRWNKMQGYTSLMKCKTCQLWHLSPTRNLDQLAIATITQMCTQYT